MNKKYGFTRVATVTPALKVANIKYNTDQIISEIKKLDQKGAEIIIFPEMSLTGYTCGDLFLTTKLLTCCLDYLKIILEETKNLNIISIIGLPISLDSMLFNCAAVLYHGKILGIVPKTYIPNYSEFYEQRWFKSSQNLLSQEITLFNKPVPIGTDLIFQDSNNPSLCFGIEICEDLWATSSPSTNACLNGATMIFNLSASNELIGKHEYRKNLLRITSAKNICAYIYTSSGVNESSTDVVFGGYAGIYENGSLLIENNRFDFATNHALMDIDFERISNTRIRNTSFLSLKPNLKYRRITFTLTKENNDLLRTYKKYPFVPENKATRNDRCKEIISIVASALAKRLKHTNIQKCILGISGGLDSTLAFLIVIAAYKKLGIDNSNLIGVTMPGFGTTNRTYTNALSLMKRYGVTIREVDIKKSCTIHFQDIGLPENDRSITYENSQARERTQILMDIANQEGALVIGTGDLSELALGWCTYNGDHMSMYALNSSIPKTLVRSLVEYFATVEPNKECQKTILDILATPISPELLPPDQDGNIKQVTENTVGPYILHDFFIYHFLRYGASPAKIQYLAEKTFANMYSKEEITKWLTFFFRRFFNQQFKRSCLPDGPKVGTISLSPRGDLRFPSDADGTIFIEESLNDN